MVQQHDKSTVSDPDTLAIVCAFEKVKVKVFRSGSLEIVAEIKL